MRALLLISVLGASLAAQAASADLRKRVDKYLEPLVAQGLFSGTVLLARGDEVLVEQGYGLAQLDGARPNTAGTRYKLLSISKTLITAAVMRLVQDGRLALADPVGKHVPGWPTAWSAVTLHDLLDHTSGIPDHEREWTEAEDRAGKRGLPVWAAFAPALQDKPLVSRPGAQYRYCNFNIEMVGLVVESVSGQGYRDFMRTKVLEPLGLETTGFDDGSRFPELAVGYALGRDGQPVETRQDLSRIQAACGLYSTVRDLYRFDRALRDPAWIAPATLRVMVTPRRGDYACSWINAPMHGRTCYRHSGGFHGYCGDFLRFPDDDATVIVLGNYVFSPLVRISQDLAGILLRVKYAQPLQPDAATLARCTGVFRSADGELLLVHPRGDKLVAFHFKGQFRSEVLLPIGNAVFAEGVAGDVRLEFERGQARRVRYLVNGRATVLQRVAIPLEKWRAAAGPLKAVPELVRNVQLLAEGDRISLQVEGRPPIEILPVDDERAVALYDALSATWLVREGDALRLRIDQIEFRLERQPR